jgi:uncharacterized protein
MEMSNQRIVPASVETTWHALNDPAVLQSCIPGCESMERVSDVEYIVLMVARIGPVNAKFKGRLLLSEVNPPDSYRVNFEGQGGLAGFAQGGAEVHLKAQDANTELSYVVHAQVGGKLAQVGSRLVDGAAKKIADNFFTAFVEKVRAAEPGTAPRI